MANTYSQINIQCIFAVKGRKYLLTKEIRTELFRYMHGILKNDNAYPLAINGWKDHVHVFFELSPKMSIADHMMMLKSTSSKWLNDNYFNNREFRWQEGYGAFSYSKSQRSNVINYIKNQEEHHRTMSFKEEYLGFLEKFEVDYEEKYVFEFY
ncbi:IS200/IS605 family transposase [Marivirga sp. S37H4]|uniref:IS200/IS605 family transposase n=1 Tax=Marivirga aurantiaca TaxID=2802615 RepID=A0A934WVH6_9BACT|nr:IS200/IS605 family transposase [Marivirga aurantiaca]MBK6263686.1 IS200/IS605 family transposase [Marivirga aurantiaca]